MSTSTLQQRIMKRRKDLRESMTSTMDLEMTQSARRNGNVLDGNEETEEMETTMDPLEEIQEAENLVEKLTSNREKKLKELSSAVEPVEGGEKAPGKAPRRKVKRLAPDQDNIETFPEQIGSREDAMEQKEAMGDEVKGKKRKGKARKDSKEPMSMEEAVIAAQTGVVPSQPSKNLNASIREKIKMKVMKAKEKAEETMREEVEKDPEKDLPSRMLRGLRARDKATRFDDPSFLTKEEEEEDMILQQSLAAKSKWKAAFKAIKAQQSILPTEEDIYDFFTRNFDPEPEEPPKPSDEEDQPGPSAAPEGETEAPDDDKTAGQRSQPGSKDKKDEEKPLLSEFFLDRDNWKDFPTEMKGPDFLPLREREDLEKGYYFIPSVATIPAEEKIVGDVEPRYLEDEGFYVGVRPEISRRNQNVMEHRLLNRPDKGEGWFGDDGRIKVLPDPLKETPTRPRILSNEEREPGLQIVYEKAVATEFDHRYIDGLGHNIRAQYQLDIDVNMLVFTHHSLFSKEHVLASKLQQMYNQFLKMKQKNTAQYLSEKLQALKLAVRNLDAQLHDLRSRKLDPEASIVNQSSQRMMDYKNEIREVRRLRDNELLHDRQLLRNILKIWKDVKALREEQGCTNTPVKLSIHKEDSSKSRDQSEWNAVQDEAVDEMRLEYDEDHRGEVERYRALLAAWKEQNKLKKGKKKKKRQGSQENLTEQDETQEDEEATDSADIPKPVKPGYNFDEEEAKATVREKMLKCRRRPGEPIVTPELSNTAVITPTHECPKVEQSRRSDMQKCKCFVKVLFNHKEVSRTVTKSLTSEFTIHFGEIFNIQIVQWPESVILQLFETGLLSNTLLAEVYSAVPETQVTTDKVHLEEFEFSSDQHVAFDHSAVGSGVSFQLGAGDSAQDLILLTSGFLMSSVSWGLGDDDTPLVPPANQNTNALSAVKHLDAVAAIGATGMIDPEKLAKWVAEARLDPNDPANANLLYLMKDARAADGQGYRVPDFFRLEQLQEEFNFVTDEELSALKRLKLIELRQQEAPEFRNYKMIPILEKEIADSLIIEYEKRKKKEEEGVLEEDMDPHRVAVAKFLGKVRERVIARFRAAQHQYSLHDVVNEEQVPDISMLGGTLVKLFEPRRPLRPQRKERKTVTAQNLSGLEVRILVNIERAVDIPIRRGTARQSGTGQTGQTSKPQVRPFVEVMFQQTVQRTSVAEGPNPNWNEELKLPFIAPNDDYSSANLQTVKDTIYLHLFDEVVTDLLEDDRDRGTNIHQRMERRWLGSISVPFTTIYFQGRVTGTFRMEAPMVLLGYDRSSENVNPGSANATYLTLFITIEPPLTSPDKLKEKFDSNEDEKLLAYAESYQTESTAKFPNRELLATVMDINGKAVFITRYFRPIKPPDDVIADNSGVKAAERVARFVSLIPFVSDSVVYPGLCDIWSSCDQFLQMLQGDEEEHAILLCNYFLHLNKKAWLINGSAIPEGSTTYILTREDSSVFWIWNPSTGEHYSQFDSFCPLKTVGCLVNHENIWFNIQTHEEPLRIDFDVTKSKLWKPFFGRSYPNPGLSSVQPTELLYYQTDREYVADLQDKIEKKLRDCIMAWRPRHITRWNRYCTQVFRQILRKLEFSQAGTDEHQAELQQILQSYNLCGFPLQMSYTEMRTVVEKVRSTGVHMNESSDVEFGLAVHIHAYPNSVLSLWVYIASMTRRK